MARKSDTKEIKNKHSARPVGGVETGTGVERTRVAVAGLRLAECGTKKKKKMAQMTEHFKVPEIIQLSSEQIVNLSDPKFKTLVIRMLTELVEFG